MICVGIGHGSMVQFPGERDYYGLEINIASKLGEDTAGPGETLISCDAFNLLSDEMKNDLEGPLQLEVGGSLYDYYLLPTRGGGAKDPK